MLLLLICWFCMGGLNTSYVRLLQFVLGFAPALNCESITKVEMDSQRDAGKQIEPIVRPSLLPNRWELNDVKEFYDKNFDFMQDPELLPLPETKRKSLSLSLNRED